MMVSENPRRLQLSVTTPSNALKSELSPSKAGPKRPSSNDFGPNATMSAVTMLFTTTGPWPLSTREG